MARIRSDLQIEKGIPAGNKVLAKPDGETEVVQIEPYKVSPTTWIADDAGIYENTPGQFEIPSLPYAKDVDTVITRGGKVYKYNSAGYFTLVVDLSGSVTALQPGDNVSDLTNDVGYLTETTHDALPQDNPHGVTKAQVGLGNVDNTSDLDKPMSIAVQQSYNQLESLINGVSSGYRGTISTSDTPTEDGVYTPIEAGTYTNAGGLIYAPDTTDQGKFVQFVKTGTSWVKNTISGGAYSKNETDVYRTLMEADILNSDQTITMVGGLPSEIIHKRGGVTIRTDTYNFSGNQVIESRELPTGEKVTLTTDTLTLTTNIVYYGI